MCMYTVTERKIQLNKIQKKKKKNVHTYTKREPNIKNDIKIKSGISTGRIHFQQITRTDVKCIGVRYFVTHIAIN